MDSRACGALLCHAAGSISRREMRASTSGAVVVITSYSIHYTKLYEKVVAAQFLHVGNRDLSPFDDDQPGFGEFVQDAREVFLGEVEARGDGAFAGRQGDGDGACFIAVVVARITSYNVCYTKLLR